MAPSRRVGWRPGDPGGDPLSAWIGPTPLLLGALAVLCAAFLAAVFLASDAGRAGDVALERYFRRRAIGSAVATGLLAIAGVFVLERDAPFVFEGLCRAGQPFIFFSAAGGVGCLTLIASGITRGARGLAIGAVVAVLAGWGVAQYPYLLPTSLSIAEGAGAPATLRWVLFLSLIASSPSFPRSPSCSFSTGAAGWKRHRGKAARWASPTRAIHPASVRTGGTRSRTGLITAITDV